MKKLITLTMMLSLAFWGCRKKPVDKAGDKPTTNSGAAMAQAADAMKRVAVKPDERARPRPAGKLGTQPIAGLERSAFVPAEAIAYGSIDSKKLIEAAKPVLLAFAEMRANKPGAKGAKAPKMDLAAIAAIGKKKYGIDIEKLGRVTLVVVVPEPTAGRRAAAFGEPVFLASAAAYVPTKAKPVETVHGARLYAPAGEKKRGRITVVGKTLLFGPTGPLKKVLAAGLGKAPRLQAAATLARSIKSMRAARPKASSYLIVDVAAARAKIKGGLGAWEKELDRGGLFFTDQALVAIVQGQPKRVAKLETLAKGLMKMAALNLPQAKATMAKRGGPAASKMIDELAAALKKTTLEAAGGTFTLTMKGSPVKVMTAAGMFAYLNLVRRSAGREPAQAAKAAAPKAARDKPPMAAKPAAGKPMANKPR